MKLLLGEPQKKEGYTTVDIFGSPDLVHDLDKPLSFLDDESVDVIEGYHLLEHLKRPDIPVKDWYRVLRPGGKVIMETPDALECMKKIIAGENVELMKKYLWGNQDRVGQYHYWGWDKEELTQVFDEAGFSVGFYDPQDYHADEAPCLRMEATK
jgi:predicted SAM-dependent methyltransferase